MVVTQHVIVDHIPESTTAYWEMLGVWFSGLMTLVAVLFALFLQFITERSRRPKLVVKHDPSYGGDQRFLPAAIGANPQDRLRQELWIRLRVQNISKNPSHDVELRFISIRSEGETRRENRPSWWFKISNLDQISVNIPPNYTQYYDMLYITYDVLSGICETYLAITQPNQTSWLETKKKIETDKSYTKLPFGRKIFIYFALVSSNTDAAYYSILVQFETPNSRPGAELPEDHIRASVKIGSPTRAKPSEVFQGSV